VPGDPEREFGLPNLELPEMQLLTKHLRRSPIQGDREGKEIVERSVERRRPPGTRARVGPPRLEKLSKSSRFGFSFE